MNQGMSHKGDCRTAPATPCLLNTVTNSEQIGGLTTLCSMTKEIRWEFLQASALVSFVRMGSCVASGVLPDTDIELCYDMGHKRRGRAIIFNHLNFEDPEMMRHGTNMDRDSLTKTLRKMKFQDKDITVFKDLELSKIQEILKALSEEDHTDADCLLVAVFTHGDSYGRLNDSDGTSYLQSKLWQPFLETDTTRVSSLAGKPKIFIIQACRGGKVSLHKLENSVNCSIFRKT